MARLRRKPVHFVRRTGEPLKRALVLRLVHGGEPFERGVDQLVAGGEFRIGGDGGAVIPGAHVLTDVAAEDLAADAWAEVFGDGPALLDG